MRIARSLLGGLFIGAVLPMVAPGGQHSFKLVRQDEGQWEIECVPRERAFTTITVEGKHFIRFVEPTLTNGDDERPGMPALPAEAFSLGIPQDASISVEVENPEYQVFENTNVAPHPTYDLTEEHEAVEVFQRDELAYAANAFFPATQIEVQSPFTLRQQRVTTIRLRPYQYNPHTQTLRKLTRATLRVRLRGEKIATSRSVAPRDPHFEETYKTLLLNCEQAKIWRIAPTRPDLVDSSSIWFETEKPYLKAGIASDGWYRITRAEMEAAGANLSGIDLASLKLFHKGHHVPIVVRQDTTVEFYAFKNYGDSSYVDYYTDTSAYWLTWGGPAGTRFDTSSSSGVPTLSTLSSMQTLHVEQNRSYFAGATTSESIDNGTVPGEDWYWQWFNANAQVDFDFSLDSIDRSNSAAFVRARLWGTGYSGSPPAAHIARVWINDSLAGDYAFGERQGGVFSASIPASWLKVGTNLFRVKNIETGAPANTFYLDWFELDYSRILRATNNQLLFHTPASPTGSVAAFAVSGFSGPQIEVYDLTSNRVITNTTVTGDSAQGFAIAFRDSISIPKTYVAVGIPTQNPVASLIQKSFTNIRQLPAGADYIVITHKNFRSQANQLAAHRNSVNGVRSVVIDVDDIYDEFNYGVKNATKLKTFLLYARNNWAAPAPSRSFHRCMSEEFRRKMPRTRRSW